jgi:hypothetical protein
MVSTRVFSQLALVALVWLFLIRNFCRSIYTNRVNRTKLAFPMLNFTEHSWAFPANMS